MKKRETMSLIRHMTRCELLRQINAHLEARGDRLIPSDTKLSDDQLKFALQCIEQDALEWNDMQ